MLGGKFCYAEYRHRMEYDTAIYCFFFFFSKAFWMIQKRFPEYLQENKMRKVHRKAILPCP